jgi:hypothetical protein
VLFYCEKGAHRSAAVVLMVLWATSRAAGMLRLNAEGIDRGLLDTAEWMRAGLLRFGYAFAVSCHSAGAGPAAAAAAPAAAATAAAAAAAAAAVDTCHWGFSI